MLVTVKSYLTLTLNPLMTMRNIPDWVFPTQQNLPTKHPLHPLHPLLNLGAPTHKVHQLATKLHCHAIKSLNKITKTRHKTQFNNNNNSDNGGSGRGVTGRAAGFRRARRRPDHMADNPPDPH
jgi:hypothetical protein